MDNSNAATNAFYYNNGSSAAYANQLASFHAAWGNDPVMNRVDGACNLGPNPTTAEVLQWAADKWGISPLVTYAEATNDSRWNQHAVGDYGCSIGIAQVAFCDNAERRNHVIRGLNGSPLPGENTCFAIDLYAAFIYKRVSGGGCAHGNIDIAIQQWARGGGVCSPGTYSQDNCASIASQNWSQYFGGQTVPY